MLFMFFKISYASFNNEFSPVLLEDIKSYCDKTLKKKNNDIPRLRSTKRCNGTERFVLIQNAIKTNVEAAKRLLKQ